MFRQLVKFVPSSVRQGGCIAAALFLSVLPHGGAMAVGFGDDDAPPPKTETTTECDDGSVWDSETERCVSPEDASGDQASLYGMARELAWAGRHDDALRILARLEDADKRLTYIGFVARKSGDWSTAETSYLTAITRNPDNFLARSYYGQGLAARGDLAGARAQLTEIRLRGGRMTWPEVALRLTLENGPGSY